MKYVLLTWLAASICSQGIAQATKTNGTSQAPKVINASDTSVPDYKPNLINLSQHPVPSAEYGTKKEELNRLRDEHEAQKKSSNEKKQRGTAPNPIVHKGIQGNTASGVPNDNDIAVSNAGMVLSVVNSNMRVYDDTGKVLLSKALTTLFAPVDSSGWISDPRVLYDAKEDRFVMVCFSGNLSHESNILVAFTKTNDPTGDWYVYNINGNPFNDSTWSDYPIIALSDKDLFMTFNQVKDNVSWTIGFKQSVIYQIDKQTGYTGVPLQYTLWSNIKHGGINNRNICPAKYQGATMGNNMYFLTLRNVAMSNDSIFLTHITNSYQSGAATLQQSVLITPTPYGFPPNARQKKTSATAPRQYLMTNDARVLAAIYENDYIHFGSNTINTAHMNASVYLGTIKNVSTATPTVEGHILESATAEYGYPSMAYMGNSPNDHRVLYTFSHCYKDSFPGTSMLYKDAAGNYSDVVSVKDGLSNINVLSDTIERWGDYTNIQRRYNEPYMAYLSGSWGKSSLMNNWVAVIYNADAPTSIATQEMQKNRSLLYPNPVRENRFTVRFDNTESGMVRFMLYDMQGRTIDKLLQTRLAIGTHEFSFDSSPLARGQYILRIQREENLVATHKVMVE